jgi:hypothetical protein
MLSWTEFEKARPDLADGGRAILYQFGVGLAFLSTVRKDGGPRVHPMCPLITDGRLLALLIPSPKANDLVRDARYAMHSFPRPNDEDAFYLTGVARRCRDEATVGSAETLFMSERNLKDRPPSLLR